MSMQILGFQFGLCGIQKILKNQIQEFRNLYTLCCKFLFVSFEIVKQEIGDIFFKP